jgi:EmrB/QacA subfamily drug resistance transporter
MDIKEHTEQLKQDKNKWLILAVIILKVLMDGLDGSMLNIALPSIGKDLGVSSGSVIWIVSVYSITTAVSVLFFGRLGDITGKAKLYLAGIFVYMISTFLSGTAQTFPMLVVSRVIQAIGAGCTMANSQGIIAMAFPQKQRGTALGIYGGALSVGALAGPTLGGIVVTYLSWRYIFLLKIPLAVVALILGLRFFPKDVPLRKEKMDYLGSFLFVAALGPLLYSLQHVAAAGGYNQTLIFILPAVSAVSFIAFFILQRKRTMPLLDFSLFRNPYYSVGILNLFILAFTNSFRGIIFPYYLQGVMNMSASDSGFYMSIAPAVIILISPVSGYISDRIGGEKLSIIGQVIYGIGMLLTAALTQYTQTWTLVLFLCIVSFGSALFSSPNNAQIISNVPREKLGIGGSASTAFRNTGSSAGVAFTTAALYGGMSRYLGYPVTDYVKDSGMDEAFVLSMRDAHLAAGMLCVLGIAASLVRMIIMRKRNKGTVMKTATTSQG